MPAAAPEAGRNPHPTRVPPGAAETRIQAAAVPRTAAIRIISRIAAFWRAQAIAALLDGGPPAPPDRLIDVKYRAQD